MCESSGAEDPGFSVPSSDPEAWFWMGKNDREARRYRRVIFPDEHCKKAYILGFDHDLSEVLDSIEK